MSKRTRVWFAIVMAIVGSPTSREAKPADAHPLKIGIIGAGKIGGICCGPSGSRRAVSSRHPDELQGLARSLWSQGTRRQRRREAAAFGDVC